MSRITRAKHNDFQLKDSQDVHFLSVFTMSLRKDEIRLFKECSLHGKVFLSQQWAGFQVKVKVLSASLLQFFVFQQDVSSFESVQQGEHSAPGAQGCFPSMASPASVHRPYSLCVSQKIGTLLPGLPSSPCPTKWCGLGEGKGICGAHHPFIGVMGMAT